MLITRALLQEIAIPLLEPFVISGGQISERRSLIVRLVDDEGHEGYGEAPAFALPFYSEETLDTCRALLTSVLLPRIVGQHFDSPAALDTALRQHVRGNPFARAAVETAGWDLVAARENRGMASVLSATLGASRRPMIVCGIALGIPPSRSIRHLVNHVETGLDSGYQRVKIKIAPGWDLAPTEAVADALKGTGIPLTVDANGSYRWPEDRALLATLDRFGLRYIEQPFAPDELLGHAGLSRTIATPVCVDETLKSALHARQLVELGGPLVWNIKVHRVGGLSEVGRIWKIGRDAGVEFWAGTMPESGIGSQASLAAASLPDFDLASDLEPSSRWFGRGVDVIKLTMDRSGRMAVPDSSVTRLVDQGRLGAATTGEIVTF